MTVLIWWSASDLPSSGIVKDLQIFKGNE
ncbi:Protein of unknown function [Pyronema omphalodes CBS 100304]|uniref:Uncharacterized protein n=1 Tax=Pyronema omphalodes (strain CBS 100304) TaxID=1076935 RepID=U4LNC4_PYROM|nr:Protein of unknown function [Pyronema omphalodes CBS 100304]